VCVIDATKMIVLTINMVKAKASSSFGAMRGCDRDAVY
jgi:hypothetical protein